MNNPPFLPNNQGVRLPNGIRVLEKKHTSRGGNAYPPEICGQVIAMFQGDGEAALNSHLASSGVVEASKEIPFFQHLYMMGPTTSD